MIIPNKVIAVGDIHWPYHDEAVWALTKKVVYYWNPDLLFFLGDNWDFYQVSSYENDPKRRFALQEDIDVGLREIAKIRRKKPELEMKTLLGNHELRMRRYLWGKAPELSQLRSLQFESLIEAERYGIGIIERGPEPYWIGELGYIHGDEVKGNNAKARLAKKEGNFIFGHDHRFSSAYKTTLKGQLHGAFGNACLCSLRPHYTMLPDWHHGFSLIYYSSDGSFSVDQRPIMKAGGEVFCLVEGKRLSVLL